MQGMGFLEFEKKIINFDKHPVAAIIAVLSLEELQTRELYMKSSKQIYTYFFNPFYVIFWRQNLKIKYD